MKTLYISGKFLNQPKTGVQRYCESFLYALDDFLKSELVLISWDIILVIPRSAPIKQLDLSKIRVLRHGYFEGHLWEQIELPQVIGDGFLLCMTNSAPIVSLLSRVKTIVVVHSVAYKYIPKSYSWTYRKFYNWLITPLVMRCAITVVTVSQSEKQSILEFYPRAKSKLKAIDIGGFSDNISPRQDLTLNQLLLSSLQKILFKTIDCAAKPFILFVGSLAYGKNIQGTLKAYQFLRRSSIDIDLVIVGASSTIFNATETTLSGLISFEYRSSIHLLGQLNDINSLVWLYQRAVCLLFPSFYESSGLPPIEAMSCGCPVVASDLPALRERCADAAIYCNPHKVDEIAGAVIQLLKDDGLRERLKVLGAARAQRFSWQNCVEEMMAVVAEVCDA